MTIQKSVGSIIMPIEDYNIHPDRRPEHGRGEEESREI